MEKKASDSSEYIEIPKTYVREIGEKIFWNALRIPDSESESEAKRIKNHLDYKKECELWHYEGCRTNHWLKWDENCKVKCVDSNSARNCGLFCKMNFKLW